MFKKAFVVVPLILLIILGIFFLKNSYWNNWLANSWPYRSMMKAYTYFSKNSSKSGVHDFSDPKVKITVNADQIIGRLEPFYNGIGIGAFNDGLMRAYNYEFFNTVGNLNQRQPFLAYLNLKNIFMDESADGIDYGAHVYQANENGRATYYWGIVDAVIDRILKNDLKPIISLSFMPRGLAEDPRKINPWYKSIISPPKDYREWQELVYRTVKHLKDRYGAEEIRTWYFEVWNEPDLYRFFWIEHPDTKNFPRRGDFDAYCKLYDYAVAGALAADTQIKIGGPAVAGSKTFLSKFLQHCYRENNYVTGKIGTQVDFISRHHYGEIEEGILPEYQAFLEKAKEICGDAFENLEILITENGPSAELQPWLNDRFVAAWIVKQVDGFLQLGDKYGANYLPDIVCFWTKPVDKNFGVQFGLATNLSDEWRPDPKRLLKRPAFNGFQVVNALGQERIEIKGTKFGDPIHGIATRNPDGSIQIALYHLFENDPLNNLERQYQVQLVINGCPNPEYTFEYYVIDEYTSNCYSWWKRMGSPKKPSAIEFATLNQKDDLTLFEPASRVQIDNGKFERTFKMQNNSVLFLKLIQTHDFVPPNPVQNLSSEVTANRDVVLEWDAPTVTDDGETATAYSIYRDGKLVRRQFEPYFIDKHLPDNANYQYAVLAMDAVGNLSRDSVTTSVQLPQDIDPPRVQDITMRNDETVEILFDELLDSVSATDRSNYQISQDIEIKNVIYDVAHNLVRLKTSRHLPGENYVLTLHQIADRARQSNQITAQPFPYFCKNSFQDNFDHNYLTEYTWTPVEGLAKSVARFFEEKQKRLMVLAGDDTRIRFSHPLSASTAGQFKIQFQPIVKYPNGGAIVIYLKQDAENYYKISNTDGYGPGKIEKFSAGQIVDNGTFSNEYDQQLSYWIDIDFAPDQVTVKAFENTLHLARDSQPIEVQEFEIELVQQDAYFDAIEYLHK
ncbi:hypothetical protein L0128_13715 [candidate division KSB1 bacterium]|nr:hypothetical protein [candidate division KSB1 bacterium]